MPATLPLPGHPTRGELSETFKRGSQTAECVGRGGVEGGARGPNVTHCVEVLDVTRSPEAAVARPPKLWANAVDHVARLGLRHVRMAVHRRQDREKQQ